MALVTVNITIDGVVVPVQLDPTTLPPGPPGPAGANPSVASVEAAIAADTAFITTLATAVANQLASTTSMVDLQALAAEIAPLLSTSTTPPATTASPSGTVFPPATSLVDSTGASWSIVKQVAFKNEAQAGITSNVALLLYFDGTIYQQNTSGNWYEYTPGTTTYWPAVSKDPRT